MSSIADQAELALAAGHRLQFEVSQNCFVLLYPEGMVELNDAAAAILARVQTETRLESLLADLQSEFEGEGLETDVRRFLEEARDRGWLRIR